MIRKIIHCDADCFFAAVELRDDPELCGLPIAVGGDPGKRGVISTCNYEARAFGVHSAMASAYAKRLCPQLIILPHNMAKYKEASLAMRQIFADYTDSIEPLSLDEAYLDVSDSRQCLGSATLIAKELRRRIAKEVGITVSAGVSGNKFLAKVASDWQKPDGMTVIGPDRVRFFLSNLPLSCLPGVGPASLKKLQELGMATCADLQQLDEVVLVKYFGQFGLRLGQLAHGEDDRPVKQREYRKSLSVEHTFDLDLPKPDIHPEDTAQLYKKLQVRLAANAQQHSIKSAFVKITFADFQKASLETRTDQLSLQSYRTLLKTLWARYQKPLRLMGMGLRFDNSQLEQEQQMPLFQQLPPSLK